MKRFPSEFEAMLSPRGLAVLAGADPACGLIRQGLRFVPSTNLLDVRQAKGALALLERTMRGAMETMEATIPPSTITGMKKNYRELLPKAVRVQTAVMDSPRSKGTRRAADIGLTEMMTSASFHAFAQALSGFRLQRKNGTQVLCYQAWDYTGPHNDHHPQDAEARHGYVDVHLTFCTDAVQQQLMIYEREGHLDQVQDVVSVGGLNCYRLPFWHQVTPLVPQPDRVRDARRWVLLGTFLDER